MSTLTSKNYGVQSAANTYAFASDADNLRFEVRSGDRWSGDAAGKERSEIATKDKLAFGTTYEISYKMMIEPGAKNTADWLLVGQIHQTEDANDLPTSPPFAIQMVGDKMQIVVRSTNDRVTKSLPPTTVLYTDTSDITRGHWYDMKIVISFDPAGNGKLSVERDGVSLVNFTGPIGFNDAVGGYWKEGVYRESSPETYAANFSNLNIQAIDPSKLSVAAEAPLSLMGTSAADHLTGGAGNDILNGGGGADRLEGGAGNDVYVVDNAGVNISEKALGGIDTVKSSVDFVLPAYTEHLFLTGYAAVNGTGNELGNEMTGNNAANTLAGLAGDDTLHGMGGDDILDGGVGADMMYGGLGNDTYIVDNLGDRVYELASEGIDTVKASVSFTLGANVENLILTGSDNLNGGGNDTANVIQGNSGANSLNGYAGSDTLYGYAGNDILNGGLGGDLMYGGAGDDTYFVQDGGDRIFENPNEGIDVVNSTITYVLPDNVEHLNLTGAAAINGTGNALDNTIVGNDAANTIVGQAGDDLLKGMGGNDTLYGGAGNDSLNGGAGDDIMWGGAGDDVYYVDSAGDKVVELANEGTDWVNSSVSFTLSNNVENLTLLGNDDINGTGNTLANIINGNNGANIISGGDGADTLRGNGGADTLVGGNGDDYLSGGDGADTLYGGAGSDVMYGGAGADIFQFKAVSDFSPASNPDRIGDFSASQGDKIDLSQIDADTTVAGVQHFTFLGAGAFTHHAGELNYGKAAGGAIMVSGDVNGDGVADFSFSVNGSSLSHSDFIF